MIVTSPSLAAITGIRHAFFTREGGVSDGIYASLNAGLGSNDHGHNVRENRRRMAAALGVAENALISCFQNSLRRPWSSQKRLMRRRSSPCRCGRDPRARHRLRRGDRRLRARAFRRRGGGVVGAAHAGWKGAIGGVLESTISAMEALGADRTRIRTAIGPLIRQPSYEVSQAFVDQFRAADEAYERFLRARQAKPRAVRPPGLHRPSARQRRHRPHR